MKALRIAVLVIAAALFGLAFMASPPKVKAHEAMSHKWEYDADCCNGNAVEGDCQEIPASAVKVVDGGYEITLRPGDHRLVTVPHTWTKATKEARWSKDENYHACLWPNEATLRCFYAPTLGY